MLSVKLLWNSFLRGHLRSLNEIKPVVLAGDLNVAHNHIGNVTFLSLLCGP